MGYDVRYSHDHGHVSVRIDGKIDVALIDDTSVEITELVTAHDCRKVLLDLRDAEVRVKAFEIFGLPARLDTIGVDRTYQRAIVVSQVLADLRFHETVMRNRGYQVRLFTDYDEAVKWLSEG